MSLLFLNPAAFWLMPAIALPILFHLFFRLRNQRHIFPSLMLFQQMDPRLSAKRKLHEMLILLLRTLFIFLFLLALARPSTGLMLGTNGVARVIIIDNSGSMSGLASDDLTKFQLACKSAEKLLEAQAYGDSSAVFLTVPDPDSTFPSGFDADPEALKNGIQKLQPTESAPHIARALRLALALLKTAKQTIQEIHIITDFQTNNWGMDPLTVQVTPAQIIVHRINTQPLHGGAISLDLGELSNRSFPAGRIIPLNVHLTNQSKEKGDIQLNVTDDSGKNRSQEITLNGSENSDVPFTFKFANPGFHWIHIWLEGDVAPTATNATVGIWSTEIAKAVFVGEQQDFGTLPFAVSPGENSDLSGVQTAYSQIQQFEDFLTHSKPPLAVILLWQHFPDLPQLKEYLINGGTVFIVPKPQVTPDSFDAPIPNWLDASIGDCADLPKEGESIIPLNLDNPFWSDLRAGSGQPKLGLTQAFNERSLRLGKSWTELLAGADGSTLMATRSIGSGRIFISGLAFTPEWTTLPMKSSFLVMIQNAIFEQTQDSLPLSQILTGDEVTLDSGTASFKVRSLSGNFLEWQGQPGDFAGLPRTGAYEFVQGDKTRWVATRSNPDEALCNYFPKTNLPLLRAFSPKILDLRSPEDILSNLHANAPGTLLYGDFITLALFTALLETWIANSSITGKRQKISVISPAIHLRT